MSRRARAPRDAVVVRVVVAAKARTYHVAPKDVTKIRRGNPRRDDLRRALTARRECYAVLAGRGWTTPRIARAFKTYPSAVRAGLRALGVARSGRRSPIRTPKIPIVPPPPKPAPTQSQPVLPLPPRDPGGAPPPLARQLWGVLPVAP